MKKAIQLVLIYMLVQVLGALIAGPLCLAYSYVAYGSIEGAESLTLAPAMLFGFLIMGWYLWKQGYLTGDRQLYSPVSASVLLWSVLAGASVVFLSDVLTSKLDFLPDWLENTFDALQAGWLGIVCVALLGPVLEELLFRGAVTKVLLRRYSPAVAIVVSGLLFGIFHLNPAQIVGASLAGFLFAWIYWRTGSLVPCILIHVLNNSLSVFLSLRYPEAESLTEVLGVEWSWAGIAVSLLVLVVSLRLLWKCNYRTDWKRSEV